MPSRQERTKLTAEEVEALRASYRPERITTLFVGESAPINGTFSYDGDNSMVRHMRQAVDSALPGEGDFLSRAADYLPRSSPIPGERGFFLGHAAPAKKRGPD
jgi:hypothetical protein